MRRTIIALVFAAGLAAGYACMSAQTSPASSEAFKLGTFEHNGSEFLGIVLRDTQVIDIAQANAALERSDSSQTRLAAPADMKELITRYDAGWRERLRVIVGQVTGAQSAPQYVHALSDLKVRPPVRPSIILNAAGNYQEHAAGIAQQQQRAGGGGGATETANADANSVPGIWERRPGDPRRNPYLFLKSPTIVIGDGDPIVVPKDRDRIDHECEFAVVIGKVAKRVPVESAADYIFGYTNEIDASDRGGRGDQGFGSDWLVGKNHDTFAPLGPFITPKEFIEDPLNLRQVFTLNGDVKQDSNTSRMTHDIYELIHFSSNLLSLNPGDVISGGSPAGTNIERAEPQWMKAGDVAVCTIDGIGALTHPVVAE
ncbi:MAG: fumarylacetoacetate hydrolase family protein [Planctomycetota bacterium]